MNISLLLVNFWRRHTFLLCTWVIFFASSIVCGLASELYTCFLNMSAYASTCSFAHSTKP